MITKETMKLGKNIAGKTAGKVGAAAVAGGFVMDAFNVFSAVGTMKVSQEEGDAAAVSLVKGVADFAIGEMFYGAAGLPGMVGMVGVNAGMQLASKHMEHTADVMGQAHNAQKGIGSGHFDMTEAGYTMRQRSLNAIRSNGANINSAFGNEARNYYLGL